MVVLVCVALRQSLLTVMRFVKRLCSRVRISTRLPRRLSETALVQAYISEDWARDALELQHCLRCSYCAISGLAQQFNLSAIYLDQEQGKKP